MTSALRVLVLAFVFVASLAVGQVTQSSRADTEDFLNAVVPFAEKMLSEHGEFFPYAQARAPDGRLIAVSVDDVREHPPSIDLIRLLKDALKAGAKAGKYQATALVYDVRVTLPSTGEKTDAIAVSLHHRDHGAVLLFIPYRIEGKRVVLGEAIAQAQENDVFTE